MKPKQVLRKKNLSTNNKLLLNQFQHSLKSPELFQQFIDSIDVNQWFPWLSNQPAKYRKKVKRWLNRSLKESYSLYAASSEETRSSLTQFLQSFAMLLLVSNPELHDHYPHTSVPEHAPRLVGEGKFQAPKKGVIFDSSEAKLLFDALENPDHKYRQRAVQAVRRFNTAVEKEKAQPHIQERGIVMQQASQKYGISANTLRGWKEMGLIHALYEGKGKQGVYLDEEEVARAVSIDQEAKRQGIQSVRLLEAKLPQQGEGHTQLAQGITASSAAREFNVPTKFLLRWAKELGVIPILSEGKGAGSATYLDREKAREVAELYHEAKRRKIQPKKLLERMSSG